MKNNLKLSIYNRYISKNNFDIVFNSCSTSLIRLEHEKFIKLKDGDLSVFSDGEITKLEEMNFVNEIEDEREYIIKQHNEVGASDNYFRLTVFTTTYCNARCPYCFEKGSEQIVPTKEIEEGIIELIKKHKEKKVQIKWFGGEPLMNAGMIDRITEKLTELDIRFTSSMISNGYLVNKNLDKINKWHLGTIQITLDGIDEKYNAIKRYQVKNDPNPFRTVLEGIKGLLSRNVKVSIRLNFDKYNYKDILECIDFIHKELGNPDNLYIYSHHIFGPKENIHLDDGTNIYSLILKRLIECGYIKDMFSLGIRYRPLPCAAYNENFFVIDPRGKLLKCEHYKTDQTYQGVVGDLKNGITNKTNYNFWLNRNYPYKKCYRCQYLPLCEGGCRFESLSNVGNGACLGYRDCIDELIFMYFLYKNTGKNL